MGKSRLINAIVIDLNGEFSQIDMIATMAEDMFNEKVMYTLNKELTKVKKP